MTGNLGYISEWRFFDICKMSLLVGKIYNVTDSELADFFESLSNGNKKQENVDTSTNKISPCEILPFPTGQSIRH